MYRTRRRIFITWRFERSIYQLAETSDNRSLLLTKVHEDHPYTGETTHLRNCSPLSRSLRSQWSHGYLNMIMHILVRGIMQCSSQNIEEGRPYLGSASHVRRGGFSQIGPECTLECIKSQWKHTGLLCVHTVYQRLFNFLVRWLCCDVRNQLDGRPDEAGFNLPDRWSNRHTWCNRDQTHRMVCLISGIHFWALNVRNFNRKVHFQVAQVQFPNHNTGIIIDFNSA